MASKSQTSTSRISLRHSPPVHGYLQRRGGNFTRTFCCPFQNISHLPVFLRIFRRLSSFQIKYFYIHRANGQDGWRVTRRWASIYFPTSACARWMSFYAVDSRIQPTSNCPSEQNFFINLGCRVGCRGRFGRGVSLYRYRSHLLVRFVGTIPTADRAVFWDLILGL